MPYKRACLISGCALAVLHCTWLVKHALNAGTFNAVRLTIMTSMTSTLVIFKSYFSTSSTS